MERRCVVEGADDGGMSDARAEAVADPDATGHSTDPRLCADTPAIAALAAALGAVGLDAVALDAHGVVVVSTFEDADLERDVLAFLRARRKRLTAGSRLVMGRGGRRLSISVSEAGLDSGSDSPTVPDAHSGATWRASVRQGGDLSAAASSTTASAAVAPRGATPLQVFTVRETRSEASRAGIEWLNADEVRTRYETSAYGIVEGAGALSSSVEECHARGGVLMLEGEAGAGKRETAELIYLRGPFSSQPFVSISCDELSERGWRYLLKSSDSPFFDADLTIYIGGLHALDDRRVRELAATLGDTALSTRCRLMLAGDDVPGGGEARQMTLLSERLRCAVSIVPALHEQGDVAGKVARYLAFLAEEFGTGAPVLDEDASRVLDAYRWPRNYLQLREVAERLYIMVGPGTVTAEIADEVLAQEEVIRTAVFNTPTLDTDLYILRPLADTDRDIARLVLERMEGNRTRTAEVLGISRTTLWRLLK